MRQFYDTFSTPLGDFSVALNATGAVIATAFGGIDELRERFEPDEVARDPARADKVRREVTEYFAGTRQRFTVKLAPSGTPFQRHVWSALARIPFGETRAYGQIAAELGNPAASRAVGRANAVNPICLIVPCHRVIGTDGSLTGFAFGEAIKRRLLDHEASLRPVLA
jgi:methylated-DNA-[protein]-cysteine S-methyltransferase